jgi:N-acetylneuraminic acid mutarotase
MCPGDCDADGRVVEAEVMLVIEEVFGRDVCPLADADGDGLVRAADLLRAVLARAGAAGCRGETPTETASALSSPTPTATPPTPSSTVSPPNTPRSTWIPLTPLPEGPRQEVGIAELDGRVYVIGGLTATGQGSRALEVYDTDTNEWIGAAQLPGARHHVGAAALAGAVYSVGGFSGSSFVPAPDTYRYDPGVNQWTPVQSLPTARGALAVAAFDGRLYAVGGSAVGGSVTDHTAYDPATNQWTPRAALPVARNHLAAVALADGVYVVGGRVDGGGNNNRAALHRYNPATNMWQALAPMPTARSGHAATVLAGRIVVMGGEVNPATPSRVFSEVEIYDPATNRWTAIDPMALPRHGIGAATVGSLIYVPGGAFEAGFAATDYSDALLIE